MTAIQTGVKPSIVLIWFIFEHYVWKCHSEQSTIPVDRYIALQTMWAQRRLHQNAPSLAVLQVPISVKLWIRKSSSVHSVYSGQISSPKQSGVENLICFSPLGEPRQPQMTRGSFSAQQTLPTPQTPYLFSEKGSKFTIEKDTKHSIFHFWVPGLLFFFSCDNIVGRVGKQSQFTSWLSGSWTSHASSPLPWTFAKYCKGCNFPRLTIVQSTWCQARGNS